MSNFVLLSTDASLWEPVTKVRLGSHDFCPGVNSFQVQAVIQAQLSTLSQAGAWGDVEKAKWDMAFLLIVSSITMGYEKVFGLVAIWVHPHQTCYHYLEEVAHKLVLLVDESMDWAYAFVQLNEGLSHVPLTRKGHISTMTDSAPTVYGHGWLHLLQIHKLLQHKNRVVCPEGLNGE